MPPPNEINALISFGNSLCYSLCENEIRHTHLNSKFSFIHSASEKRHSLALDIAEIFKPIFVDRLIFKLINNKMLTKKHFEYIGNACLLNKNGKNIFLEEWKNKLNSTIYHRKLKRNVNYKELVKLDIYKLEKYILNISDYEPFKIWW